jgi:uncharacterized protein YbgA (DUF1722 family)
MFKVQFLHNLSSISAYLQDFPLECIPSDGQFKPYPTNVENRMSP